MARHGDDIGMVEVVDGDGPRRLLTHHVQHSPTGYSWGYAGSGPAELAKDMLWDFLGACPAPPVYQRFKFQVIALLPGEAGFEIDARDLFAWIDRFVAAGGEVLVADPHADGDFGGYARWIDPRASEA